MIHLLCSKCSSEDIRADAWAAWNVELQCWELAAEFPETTYCMECDCITSIKELTTDGELDHE